MQNNIYPGVDGCSNPVPRSYSGHYCHYSLSFLCIYPYDPTSICSTV